jgi:hypothetical protein
MLQTARTGLNITAELLKIDGLNLLLPQGEIRTLEPVTQLDVLAPALHSVGWITYSQKRWPVYCLSEDLSLMAIVPPARRVCALMVLGTGFIGIVCDDMIVLKDFAAQRYELPVAMRLPGMPVLNIVAYEQGIACVSNARHFTSYIEQLVLNA